MLRLENIPPEEMNEVVRVASELYEHDQTKAEAETQRQATVEAAEELGLPAEYLHRAAEELHLRKVERLRQKQRKRFIFTTSLAAVFGLILILWSFGWFRPAPPALAPYRIAATEGVWDLSTSEKSIAKPILKDGVTIHVERFVARPDGTYFANLDSRVKLPTLTGYKNLTFRLRGSLPNARVYLENGPTERWRSPELKVEWEWTSQTLPLDQFEYQTRGSSAEPWRVERYRAPEKAEKVSLKVGHFINDVSAHGDVSIDNLEFK